MWAGGRAMKGGTGEISGFFPKTSSDSAFHPLLGGGVCVSIFTAGKAKEAFHNPLKSLAAFVREVLGVTSLEGAWANGQQSHPQVFPYTFTMSRLQPANPVAHRLKNASGDRHSCHTVFDFLRQLSPQGAFNRPPPNPTLLRWHH